MLDSFWFRLLGVAFLLSALGYVPAPAQALERQTETAEREIVVGDKAPAFGAPDLEGNGFTLQKALREMGPDGTCLALVFFTTRCPSCNKEILQMKSESARLAGSGVRIVLVAAGENGIRTKSFLERLHVTFQTVTDSYLEISKLYRLTTENMTVSVPRIFLVGSDGNVLKIIDSSPEDVVPVILGACVPRPAGGQRGVDSERPAPVD